MFLLFFWFRFFYFEFDFVFNFDIYIQLILCRSHLVHKQNKVPETKQGDPCAIRYQRWDPNNDYFFIIILNNFIVFKDHNMIIFEILLDKLIVLFIFISYLHIFYIIYNLKFSEQKILFLFFHHHFLSFPSNFYFFIKGKLRSQARMMRTAWSTCRADTLWRY